jgi:hypothetical protein
MDKRRGLALACALACLAGCGGDDRSAELTAPRLSGTAGKIKFDGPRQAARSLLPGFERTIPLSTFAGATGLRVGVRIEAKTEGGKTLVGTVKAIGRDAVTVDVESWSWQP